MTNRSMVKPPAEGAPPVKPNPAPPTPVPAPESDADRVLTTEDPMDSPQHKPMIRQDKSRGLRTR